MTTSLPGSRSFWVSSAKVACLAKPMCASFHSLPGRGREAEDWEYPTSRSAAAGPSHHLLIAIVPDGTPYDQDFSSLAARDLPSVREHTVGTSSVLPRLDESITTIGEAS